MSHRRTVNTSTLRYGPSLPRLPLAHLNKATKQYERSHLLLWLWKTVLEEPLPAGEENP